MEEKRKEGRIDIGRWDVRMTVNNSSGTLSVSFYLRSLLHAFFERIAYFALSCQGRRFLYEFVVDVFMDEGAWACTTALTHICKDGVVARLNGLVHWRENNQPFHSSRSTTQFRKKKNTYNQHLGRQQWATSLQAPNWLASSCSWPPLPWSVCQPDRYKQAE